MKLYNTKSMLKEFCFQRESINVNKYYAVKYSCKKETIPQCYVSVWFTYQKRNNSKYKLDYIDVSIDDNIIKTYKDKEITKILKDRFYLSKDLYLLLNYLFGSDVYCIKRYTGESWTGWTIDDIDEAIFAITEDKEYSKTVSDDDKHDILESLEDIDGGVNYDDMTYLTLEMLQEKYNWEN